MSLFASLDTMRLNGTKEDQDENNEEHRKRHWQGRVGNPRRSTDAGPDLGGPRSRRESEDAPTSRSAKARYHRRDTRTGKTLGTVEPAERDRGRQLLKHLARQSEPWPMATALSYLSFSIARTLATL